jgi:hypothetical protein
MVINNPWQNIVDKAVLVVRVRIFFSPKMAVSVVESAVICEGTLIRKEDKAYEVMYMYRLSEQPSTKVDTSNKVNRSHRLHLLEVVGLKMLFVENLPYHHVVYHQGVCNASVTSIRLFFKTLDYSFFVRLLRGRPQRCLLGLTLPVSRKHFSNLGDIVRARRRLFGKRC